jgi:hypothetical protein
MKSVMISEYKLKELEKLIENHKDKKRHTDRLNCSTENRIKFNGQGTKHMNKWLSVEPVANIG